MNIPTCYRCPERHKNGTRCEILQAKVDSVRGLGLTSIKFKCERRLSLFSPGDVVSFEIYDKGFDPDEDSSLKCRGIVMRTMPRKVLVYVDGEAGDQTDRPIVNLNHDRVEKTGERHPVCIHCGKPKDRDIVLTNKESGEDLEWSCREDYDETYGQTPILPCVYGGDR